MYDVNDSYMCVISVISINPMADLVKNPHSGSPIFTAATALRPLSVVQHGSGRRARQSPGVKPWELWVFSWRYLEKKEHIQLYPSIISML